jgi:DNA-binding HxlR family transcriptional regulator
MIDIESKNSCSISRAMQILGGKWKIIILSRLMDGKLRFGELSSMIPLISGKVLGDQLKEMERDGLVLREQFNQIPPRVEYSLTEGAIQLKKILQDLCDWQNKHSLTHQKS